MTIKEAIGQLRCNVEGDYINSDDLEAFDVAIQALEKQIPKHIEEQTEEDRQFVDYVCPNCKVTLQQKMKGATRTTICKYKHCIDCGQALDWSEHPNRERRWL